ncbi:hypothetical protein RS022_07300 [Candidatus Phytoplasma rubi]|uniref:Uncharacterized protein n=1 Tax=Candidatus Phytoplasma rubi TaxID=399025 RepID=A0ABY7BTV1_9MOLU|nr:hypothetical protein RS022_07300 [Candidatus Phytoplasma rubi]
MFNGLFVLLLTVFFEFIDFMTEFGVFFEILPYSLFLLLFQKFYSCFFIQKKITLKAILFLFKLKFYFFNN